MLSFYKGKLSGRLFMLPYPSCQLFLLFTGGYKRRWSFFKVRKSLFLSNGTLLCWSIDSSQNLGDNGISSLPIEDIFHSIVSIFVALKIFLRYSVFVMKSNTRWKQCSDILDGRVSVSVCQRMTQDLVL